MKTNELNNGIKEVYTKPALGVENIEVQWDFLSGTTFSAVTEGAYTAKTPEQFEIWILELLDTYPDLEGVPDTNPCV